MTTNWFKKVKSTLPEPSKIATLWSESDYYVASHIISSKPNLNHVPVLQSQMVSRMEPFSLCSLGAIQLGLERSEISQPCCSTGGGGVSSKMRFDNAVAVGASFLYVDGTNRKRISRSLLIVPFHSLDNVVRDYDEERYFVMLDPFLQKFDRICRLHSSLLCAETDLATALERRSIP